MIVIIGGLELEEHEIAGPDGWGKKEDLHGRVVHRDKAGEEVQVPGQEHKGKQQLRPAYKSLHLNKVVSLVSCRSVLQLGVVKWGKYGDPEDLLMLLSNCHWGKDY